MATEARKQDWAILDLKPGADPAEIEKAYRRRLELYRKDSLATYTLLTEEERSGMVDRIEQAYTRITGRTPDTEEAARHSPQARGSHDSAQGEADGINGTGEDETIAGGTGRDTTDRRQPGSFTTDSATGTASSQVAHVSKGGAESTAAQTDLGRAVDPSSRAVSSGSRPHHASSATSRQDSATGHEPALEESEPDPARSPGAFLRYQRRARGLCLEDVASETKIRGALLDQLEAERFSGLPAEVYVRGFVIQYARAIGLSEGEAIAGHYLARMRATGLSESG